MASITSRLIYFLCFWENLNFFEVDMMVSMKHALQRGKLDVTHYVSACYVLFSNITFAATPFYLINSFCLQFWKGFLITLKVFTNFKVLKPTRILCLLSNLEMRSLLPVSNYVWKWYWQTSSKAVSMPDWKRIKIRRRVDTYYRKHKLLNGTSVHFIEDLRNTEIKKQDIESYYAYRKDMFKVTLILGDMETLTNLLL